MSHVSPRVSVVVPTRGRAHVLPRALASVLAQTTGDLEVIVVADGGEAECAPVRAAVDDPRVRWIPGPEQGVAAARNAGIAVARAPWVAFLDDDNEWRPTALADLLDLLDPAEAGPATPAGAAHPVDPVHPVGAVDAVAGLGTEVDDGHEVPQPPPPDPDLLVASSHGWYPYTSAVMVRRAAVDRAGGFPTHLHNREDWHLWLRLALAGRWRISDRPVMRRHSDGGDRLGDDWDAGADASGVLVRELGPAVRRRLGWRAYARWLRHNRVRPIVARMQRHAPRDGRRAGWAALRALLPTLPWTAAALGHPLLLWTAGPTRYERMLAAYHRRHRARPDRQ